MAKPTNYKLKYSLEISDEIHIKEVTVQPRVKGKHMRQVAGSIDEIEQGLRMVAAVTGLEDDIVDEMDETDVKAILNIVKKNRVSKTQG